MKTYSLLALALLISLLGGAALAGEPEPLTYTSLLDGRPLSPSEYIQERQRLQNPDRDPPTVAPELQEIVTLLRFRKVFRALTPF
jgi:hypothetical protein